MITTTASATLKTCETIPRTVPFQPTNGERSMSKAEELQRIYEANIACGDISGIAEARMLAEITAAEAEEHAALQSVAV